MDTFRQVLTRTYDWGTIKVGYSVAGTNLNLAITTTNSSANTLKTISYEALTIHFPSKPDEYDGNTPVLGTNVGDPTILRMTASGTVLALCNDDVVMPLLAGFPWAIDRPSSMQNFPLRINTDREPMYPTSLPTINRPIPPGGSDTYRLSLRFAPATTSNKVLAADVYAAFSAVYPFRLDWPDRRPIGTLVIGTAATGWPTNPRGWLLDPSINVTTPAGVAAFQARLLAWADGSIAILKSMNAQGMITWDIEGEQFPHAVTYVGDPRQFETTAPEMSGVADEYFRRFRNAGLRVGVGIRPQNFVLAPGGGSATQTTAADPAQLLIDKITYAKNRWGATLFYVDSNGDPSTPMDFSIFKRVAAAFPDILLIPEHENTAYFSITAPYNELRGGIASTPTLARDIYPRAFSNIYVPDGPIDARYNDLLAAVQQGDVMLFRGWFDDVYNAKVSGLYGTTRDLTPPAVSITAPDSGATVSGTINLSASATDNVGVAGVRFLLDGAQQAAELLAAPYTIPLDTTRVSNGSHTLTVIARDVALNVGTATVTFTVNNLVADTIPPVAAIVAPAANATVAGSVTITATASDNVGVTGAQFQVDGANLGNLITQPPYAAAWNTISAANGPHTIGVSARDAAGNTGSASITVTVNNVAPPSITITSPAAGSTVSSTIALAASVTDIAGVAGVRFLIDNAQAGAELTQPPYSMPLNSLTLSNGNHVLTVIARDAAGNSSSASVTFLIGNTAPDTTPPSFNFITPIGNSTVSGTIAVTVNATDNVAVAGVRYLIDGIPFGVEVAAPPYAQPLNTLTLTGGLHTLTAIVRDTSNNVNRGDMTFSVNNPPADATPPNVAFTSPAAGSVVNGTITLSVNASANLGVAGVKFLIDGTQQGAEIAAPPYAMTLDTTGLGNGSHTVTALARDAAGRLAAASVTVTVSNGAPGQAPPVIVITSPAVGSTVSASITLAANVTSNIAVAGVSFAIDNSPVGTEITQGPYSMAFNSLTVANGNHLLTVTARDADGNSSSLSGAFSVGNPAVDTVLPLFDFVAPIPNSTVSGTVSVTVTATDYTGVAGVRFLIDNVAFGVEVAAPPYTQALDTRILTGGLHTISAIIRGASNNTTRRDMTFSVSNPM